ncbi:MAG: ribulose-phosphate 3-epimerase [Anaerolineales bacterium]
MPYFKISPSLASVSLLDLRDALAELEKAKIDYLHFDIEDGVFVPLMTLGTKLISDLRPLSKLPFDVHLMMVDPEWIIPELLEMGADRISVHYEACPYPRRVLRRIVEQGGTAGLAINPATPLPDLEYLEPYLSFLVILTTEPEGPDCPYLPTVIRKLDAKTSDPYLGSLEWVVDGGVSPENIQDVVQAGADTVVVGRAVFQGGRIQENIAALRAAAELD